MRTKSESRRQAILEAAAEVFRETGFERTTMALISEKLGYSKATLYSYFRSKDELLFEVMLAATYFEFEALLAQLDTSIADIRVALEHFGHGLLSLLYSPRLQAMRRLVVSEAGRSDLGRRCFELGPARFDAAVSDFLQRSMDAGLLRQADARAACHHLKGLIEAEWFERFVFHCVPEADEARLEETVRRAVGVFLAAYGPEREAESSGQRKERPRRGRRP